MIPIRDPSASIPDPTSTAATVTIPPTMANVRPARRFWFSSQLKEIADRVGERPIRLDELAAVFQGRASNVLLILLALPFLTPVPLPLLSVPFGIIIALSGLCMALRRKPWLPPRLADKQLPAGALTRILSAAGRIIGWLERLARPRWIYAHGGNRIVFGADEDDALFLYTFRKSGVFAQEAITRMHGLRPRLLAGRDDFVGQQITFAARCAANVHRFVGQLHMPRILVCVGIDGHRLDTHLLGGRDHTVRNYKCTVI